MPAQSYNFQQTHEACHPGKAGALAGDDTGVDLCLEVFVSLDKGFPEEVNLFTWFYRIVKNTYRDHIRGRAFKHQEQHTPFKETDSLEALSDDGPGLCGQSTIKLVVTAATTTLSTSIANLLSRPRHRGYTL